MRTKLMLMLALLAAVVLAADKRDKTFPPLLRQLHVYVTNQSPNDDPVHVEVSVDGRVVFDKKMPFAGAHYVDSVSTNLTAGMHTLSVRSKTTKASQTIEFNAESTNWYAISYWYYTTNDMYGPVPRKFEFRKEKGPFMID